MGLARHRPFGDRDDAPAAETGRVRAAEWAEHQGHGEPGNTAPIVPWDGIQR